MDVTRFSGRADRQQIQLDYPWLAAFAGCTLLLASTVLRTVGALGFLIVIFVYSFHVRKKLLPALLPALPLVALPALALLSVLWSEAPGSTIKNGIQYALTFYYAVLIARTVPSSKIVSALLYGLLIICLMSLADLHHAISGHRAFQGVYESKNAMAFVAATLALVSVGILIDSSRTLRLRTVALGSLPLALGQLVLAQSAGAVVSTAIAACILILVSLLGRTTPSIRLATLLLLIVCIPAILVARPILETSWENFATDKLHKDIVSMTGRTIMWAKSDELMKAKPLLGHGYQACWIQGSLDPEALWEQLDIRSRSGFNFHNQYRELRVDLGWTGLIIFCAVMIAGFAGLAVRTFIAPNHTLNTMLALFISLVLRTPVESLLFYQFSILSVLFITLACVGVAGLVQGPSAVRTTPRSSRQRRFSRPVRSTSSSGPTLA